MSLYHLSGIPVQYVIDPAGKIVHTSFIGYGLPTTDLADAHRRGGRGRISLPKVSNAQNVP